ILNDEFCLAVNRQHDRRSGLLELLHELRGLPLEIGEGMDVPGEVNHGLLYSHRNRTLSYATPCTGPVQLPLSLLCDCVFRLVEATQDNPLLDRVRPM